MSTNSIIYPFFPPEEYDIEELCTVFDNFVMGNVKVEATPENPCKLALVNDILKQDLVKLEIKQEPISSL